LLESDHQLVKKCLAGDRRAFDALYERHVDLVYNLARRLTGSRTLADDIAQETFISAFRGLAGWRQRGQFSTWLCGIACNIASGRERDSIRKPEVSIGSLHDELAASGEDVVESISFADRLECALLKLPQPIRVTFLLVRTSG
jgi:RNA polymerase sigma-70 factor (ECF subfamily)